MKCVDNEWKMVLLPVAMVALLSVAGISSVFLPGRQFFNLDNPAVAAARQAVADNPADPGARVRLGRAYYENRDFAAAREQLETAVGMDKNSRGATQHLGRTYMQLGQLNMAEEMLTRALTLSRFPEQVYADLGDLAMRKNDAAGAIAFYTLALQKMPGTAEQFLQLARAYEAQGLLELAAEARQKGNRLSSRSAGMRAKTTKLGQKPPPWEAEQ